MKLREVLVTLVGNALKFSPRGGVVELTARRDGERCVFSVRDHGIGIAPEHQEIVFEAFRQVEDGQTRRFGGTGLGLSISKQLVELQGGRIRVESELGIGSTFTVDLPCAATAVRAELPAGEASR